MKLSKSNLNSVKNQVTNNNKISSCPLVCNHVEGFEQNKAKGFLFTLIQDIPLFKIMII